MLNDAAWPLNPSHNYRIEKCNLSKPYKMIYYVQLKPERERNRFLLSRVHIDSHSALLRALNQAGY